jgi:molybdenum cofactor synthesis domain-containing protein
VTDPQQNDAEIVTAALCVIGDEILSGRTKDKNIGYIADYLSNIGIQLKEVRVVPDEEKKIVDAVNALRSRYTYVFTTGGIGPTHDDITADAVARAFGVAIDHHPEAVNILMEHFAAIGHEPNEARLRMARIPQGGELIRNSVSKAPGFRVGNVFVMAGVPKIMQAMLDEIGPRLVGGPPMLSRSVTVRIGEGDLAKPLADIQKCYPDVVIGSYPFEEGGRFGASIVLRSRNAPRLDAATADVEAMAAGLASDGKVVAWT